MISFRNQSGITLIEVMIALLLFGIALGGILFALNNNLLIADSLRNNTVAAGLAQEGIEVVRNIRDQEWLSSETFGSNIPAGTHEVQWDSIALSSSQSRYLKKDANGIFSYGLGTDTIFKRTITISDVCPCPNPNEKRITVDIVWNIRGGTRTLSAEEHLFNWY